MRPAEDEAAQSRASGPALLVMLFTLRHFMASTQSLSLCFDISASVLALSCGLIKNDVNYLCMFDIFCSCSAGQLVLCFTAPVAQNDYNTLICESFENSQVLLGYFKGLGLVHSPWTFNESSVNLFYP